MAHNSLTGDLFRTLPHHMGIVVRDIDRAIFHLESLGLGPFKSTDGSRVSTVLTEGELRGQPAQWKTRYSNAKMGPVELELLEPLEEPQALRESLDAVGEGLHHIGWLTTDLRGDIARLTQQGAKVWTCAFRVDGPSFVYFEPTVIGNLAIELREP